MGALPDWADESLSRDLPILRSRGEGQHVEYMQAFPENTRELAKEIAAFATSNAGTILVGVSDAGDLSGLAACATAAGRDQLIKRLEGISRGTVKPAVTPTAKFALEGEAVVLVVSVPKGSQPVYYCGNVPYLRHLSESRPAEPHEVIERIAEYLGEQVVSRPDEPNETATFYSALARALVEIVLLADERGERLINPWLDMWRSEYGYQATELRELAAGDVAIKEGLVDELSKLAKALDSVASLRLYLGVGDELERLTRDAAALASRLLELHIDPQPLSKESLDVARSLINTHRRRLDDLASRAEAMADAGRMEDLQAEASEIGHDLLRLSYYRIDPLGAGLREELRRVGRALHLTETMQLYMDGGVSTNAVLNHISKARDELSSVAQSVA